MISTSCWLPATLRRFRKNDIATTAIGNLEKSKKGFNAIVKIHYPEEKDRNVLYGK